MNRNNRGFTLIEVMVAVGVIAIALPAMLFAMMSEIDGAGYMRDKLQAQWVASNVLEEARIQNRLNGAVPEEESSGEDEMVGRKWLYKVRTKAFPQKELSDIYGVEVSVFDADNKEGDALAKLVGILRQYKKEPIVRSAGQAGGGTPTPPTDQGITQ